ncbi:FHS family L-fucose permease-like MFS transporter [Edaphobacter aggregans]|uniref:FHS family L-fucose permease-like MFS transporter n=1 Tax=Edaphobacter aggregans TaxID=570835 RepID=A0A3R9Q8E8_9BACT|nr:L-fucose:H+ symporter permease [Edaphobacter aggregans]RSL15766.1 FHS family L-fucose permease-like MFS transporter [Edaphobacter aggregans]
MQVSTSAGGSVKAEAGKKHPVFPVGQMLPFVLVTVLFFLWGMSNNLTDILVQQFRKSFELSQFGAQLVQTANFFGYFCMAIPAALLMRKWGYKAGMVTGLLLFGTGMVLFWPAAVNGQYAMFLIALFTVGSGASILETAANPFIAQFGDPVTSEQRLNFSQSFNPPGTITGVLIGTYFIFSGVEPNAAQIEAMKVAGTYHAYLHGEIMRVVPTYLTFGAVVLLCAFILSRTKFPVIQSEHEGAGEDHGSFGELLKIPAIWIAVAANFCNVGAQISSWSSLIPYMKQYTAVSERTAALYLLGTLIALAAGRFVSTPLMRFVRPSLMLGVYGVMNALLMLVAVLRPGLIGAWAVVASGFFLSIMFPTIFALGLKGLGRNTKIAGSLLVMAIVGGAIFPPVLGLIAKHTGSLALGYVVPLAGFVGVALYGFYQSTQRTLLSGPAY